MNYAFPKDKKRNFAEIQAGLTKVVPGPGQYKTQIQWGMPEKKVPVLKKNTYIDAIVKFGPLTPSGAAVSIKTDVNSPFSMPPLSN